MIINGLKKKSGKVPRLREIKCFVDGFLCRHKMTAAGFLSTRDARRFEPARAIGPSLQIRTKAVLTAFSAVIK